MITNPRCSPNTHGPKTRWACHPTMPESPPPPHSWYGFGCIRLCIYTYTVHSFSSYINRFLPSSKVTLTRTAPYLLEDSVHASSCRSPEPRTSHRVRGLHRWLQFDVHLGGYWFRRDRGFWQSHRLPAGLQTWTISLCRPSVWSQSPGFLRKYTHIRSLIVCDLYVSCWLREELHCMYFPCMVWGVFTVWSVICMYLIDCERNFTAWIFTVCIKVLSLYVFHWLWEEIGSVIGAAFRYKLVCDGCARIHMEQC